MFKATPKNEEMKPEVWKVLEPPPHQNSRRKAPVVLKVEHDQFTGDRKAMQVQGLDSLTRRLHLCVLPTLSTRITQEQQPGEEAAVCHPFALHHHGQRQFEGEV